MSGSKARLARRRCERNGHGPTKALDGGVICLGCDTWLHMPTYPAASVPAPAGVGDQVADDRS